MKTIHERLDILEAKMRSEHFRENKGLGNEIGYYVFDYEPEDELVVRQRIDELSSTDTEMKFGYELIVYDLYELMIQLLKEEDAFDELLALEEEEGSEYIYDAISDILKFDEPDSLMVNYIADKQHTPDDAVVLLTGVGKCFPIIRSHKILNNLHQVMDHCPVIMFFPGRYDWNQLRIFGDLKDDNYYRAFPIVER